MIHVSLYSRNLALLVEGKCIFYMLPCGHMGCDTAFKEWNYVNCLDKECNKE